MMEHRTILLALTSLAAALLYLALSHVYYKYAGGKVHKLAAEGGAVRESESKLPDPTPLHNFDLSTAKTRNYVVANKCVRWPYFQTMAHQPMHIDNWIEVDKDYAWYIKEKLRVVEEEGARAVDSLPENDEAAGELLELVVDFLPKRFPTLFEPLEGGIHNKTTGISYPNTAALKGVNALKVVAGLTQCDFLMAREQDDGHFVFTGGIVAFPGFYLLSEKIGKTMEQVHAPVPDFNEKLLLSVERTLKRFKSNEPFERASWEIVDDWQLFRHNMVNLPEDAKLDNPADLLFRIDRQTFRKLPRTRGVIFGVHPILKRLSDLADDPLIPALLKTVHENGAKHLMDYKLAPLYQDSVLPYLAGLHQSQIDRGLIKGDEAVADFRKLAEATAKA